MAFVCLVTFTLCLHEAKIGIVKDIWIETRDANVSGEKRSFGHKAPIQSSNLGHIDGSIRALPRI